MFPSVHLDAYNMKNYQRHISSSFHGLHPQSFSWGADYVGTSSVKISLWINDKLVHLAVPKTKKEAPTLVSHWILENINYTGGHSLKPLHWVTWKTTSWDWVQNKKGLEAVTACGTSDNVLGNICPSWSHQAPDVWGRQWSCMESLRTLAHLSNKHWQETGHKYLSFFALHKLILACVFYWVPWVPQVGLSSNHPQWWLAWKCTYSVCFHSLSISLHRLLFFFPSQINYLIEPYLQFFFCRWKMIEYQ